MRQFVAMFLVMAFVQGIAVAGSAAANITFTTKKVYFAENGNLIVDGYFRNHGSHNGIADNVHLKVYNRTEFGISDDLISHTGFGYLNVFVPSKGTTPCYFVITGVQWTLLEQPVVSSGVDFQW